MTIKFANSQGGGFSYYLAAAPVPALPGQHSLTITSTFAGAKNPNEAIKRFQAVMPAGDLKAIGQYLDRESVKELQGAVAELLEAFVSGKCYETKNPYSRPAVQRGLRALGRTTGISTFGSDWMDVLGKWEELNKTLEEIAA